MVYNEEEYKGGFVQKNKNGRQKNRTTLHNEHPLDAIGWQCLSALQQNARLSFRELGRLVGLSAPAATERIHRMQEAGIIEGYRAEINLAKIGLPITAFVRISVSSEKSGYIATQLQSIPEVLECYRVAGVDSYIMKVCTPSIADLEDLIDQLGQYGHSTTSIVLSTTVRRGSIDILKEY